MTQDLNCGLFELPPYNSGLSYGFDGIMRQAAQTCFCLNHALIAFFFSLWTFKTTCKRINKRNSLAYNNNNNNNKDVDLQFPHLPPLGDYFTGTKADGSSRDGPSVSHYNNSKNPSIEPMYGKRYFYLFYPVIMHTHWNNDCSTWRISVDWGVSDRWLDSSTFRG